MTWINFNPQDFRGEKHLEVIFDVPGGEKKIYLLSSEDCKLVLKNIKQFLKTYPCLGEADR